MAAAATGWVNDKAFNNLVRGGVGNPVMLESDLV
jgi:hypothetical protein